MAVPSGHRSTGSEDEAGSLEVGHRADLVVLAENPLTCPEDRIKDIPVAVTMVAGRGVHDAGPTRHAPGREAA